MGIDLASLRWFIEYLEGANVRESAKPRVERMVDYWRAVEARLLKDRYTDNPATFVPTDVYSNLMEGQRLSEKSKEDSAWVKSQLVDTPPSLDAAPDGPPPFEAVPTRKRKGGRTKNAEREKSRMAVRDLLEKNRPKSEAVDYVGEMFKRISELLAVRSNRGAVLLAELKALVESFPHQRRTLPHA